MKRALSLFLSLALLLALALPVRAASYDVYTTPDRAITFQAAAVSRWPVTLLVGDYVNTVDATVITVRSGSSLTIHSSFLAEYYTETATGAYTQVASGADLGPASGVTQVEQLLTYRSNNGLALGVLTYSAYDSAGRPTVCVVLLGEGLKATAAAYGTAYARTQNVELDGRTVTFHTYALKDPNSSVGGETNYVQIRDLALALRSTAAQFEVNWESATNAVVLTTGQPYTTFTGTENNTPFSGDRAYNAFNGETRVNGAPTAFDAITLTDDRGGDYTYYQLRDLGRILGFNVYWDEVRRIICVESDKPYTG